MKNKLSNWAVFFIVLMTASSLATPFTGDCIKTITESLTEGNIPSATQELTKLVILYLAIGITSFGAEFGLLTTTRTKIDLDRLEFLKKSVDMTFESVERIKSSKIRNIINDSISEVANSIVQIARQSSSILMMLATVGYVTYIDWKLGLTMVGIFLLSMLSVKIYSKFSKANMETINKLRDEKAGMYNSLYLGFHQWFANHSLDSVKSRLAVTLTNLTKSFKKDVKYDSLIDFVMNCMLDLGLALQIYIIIISTVNDGGEVGLLPMMISFTGVISYGIHSTAHLGKAIASYKTHRDRIKMVMDEDSIHYGNQSLNKTDNYRIEFNIDSFSYPMNPEVEILKDLNLSINGYGMYSLVSASGTGKSTLLRLLTRLYDGYKGSIKINGFDVKTLTKESLRDNIYMIQQSPYFCDLSIRDNFTLECPEASDEEIISACRNFNIIEDLLIANKGLDTQLGESGLNLSGGQKQLMSMAKLLIKAKTCKILILDEATSALDGANQDNVLDILKDLSKDHIILMVNHRMSMNIDSLIYYLDENKNLHIGSHSQLMTSSESYKSLYSKESNS